MMPHECVWFGVYVSPLLPMSLLGIGGAGLTVFLGHRVGISRFVANMPWVFVALSVLYTCLLYAGGTGQ